MKPRPPRAVESTIGLIATIVSIIATVAVLALAGLTITAGMDTPRQTITQERITTGGVQRLCVVARTGQRIDAMDCELIDARSGGVA